MGSFGKKKIHAVAWEKRAELMNQFFFLAWVKNVAAATVSETLSNLYPPDSVLLGKTQTHLKWQIENEKWGNPMKRETINVNERFEVCSDHPKWC